MKKNLHIFVIGFITVLYPLLAAAQDSVNDLHSIISVPLANVHEDSTPKSRVKTQVLMGDVVRVLEKRDNRYRIAILSQGKREGWIQQEAVLDLKGNAGKYLSTKRQWIVITTPKSEALIFDKTGNHKVSLYAGTRLPVLQKTEKDYKIQFPDRSVALVHAAAAKPERSSDPVLNDTKPEEIANTAKQFSNVRYLDGGLTSQGIDMHGLIYITYRIQGISLEPDRTSLIARSLHVSKKDLEPGDILIFHGETEGLFLGNGRFLQTTRKGTVHIVGIYDKRFANALQYGLRIIGAGPEEKKRPADLTADEILLAQVRALKLSLGKRIAYWAGRFIGTPYDPDPLGLYVRTKRIIADERVDCMYHIFRSVELALSSTPDEAVAKALTLRFISNGKLVDGLVVNYDDRFQYGEDMVVSGKWGKDITATLGKTASIVGSRGRETIDILPKSVLATRSVQKKLQDGDIVYWVKDPKKRSAEEIVGHLSIIRVKSNKIYVIHAAGDKDRLMKRGGGAVKEILLTDYINTMRFIGALVTRFQ
ncbi:MAG TPA: NlpC/P60 family protein [Nitrospirota bacterium]|nr:NlpC/P60 family protein [Nitrospirota bacterium]